MPVQASKDTKIRKRSKHNGKSIFTIKWKKGLSSLNLNKDTSEDEVDSPVPTKIKKKNGHGKF